MPNDRTSLEHARNLFAAVLSRVSGRHVPEIELAFRAIHREAFFPDGPWLTLTPAGYVPTPSKDGWTYSRVFDRKFRLTRVRNRLGGWSYTLETRRSDSKTKTR